MINCLKDLNQKSFWLKFLISNIEEEDTQVFSRLLFANALLVVVGILMFIFSIYHLIFTKMYTVGLIDALALCMIVALFIHLRIKKSVQLFGHFMAVGTVVLYYIFMVVTQNENMSFIWVIFVPFLIILVNGWKEGVWYVLSFYAIVFPLAYFNIGVWESGDWNSTHAYRFIATLILALIIALLIDFTQVCGHKREIEMRKKQRLYLDELKIMSRTDGLTGLYNRYYFNQIFAEKVQELQNSTHSLMFFIVDIDYFKSYNDYYGHQAGDEVIQKIAATIQHYIHRENDLVFRLGGEEFGGLLVARDTQQMEEWLVKLSDAIAALKIKHAPNVSLPWVTISGGVSSMKSTKQMSMEELYKNADDALYKAKNEGRNRFVIDTAH